MSEKNLPTVYVVAIAGSNEPGTFGEAIVTVFNNRSAAVEYCKFAEKTYNKNKYPNIVISLDECPIYTYFSEAE